VDLETIENYRARFDFKELTIDFCSHQFGDDKESMCMSNNIGQK
jgi:hypothetical protein